MVTRLARQGLYELAKRSLVAPSCRKDKRMFTFFANDR
jgi:hypothetical protein